MGDFSSRRYLSDWSLDYRDRDDARHRDAAAVLHAVDRVASRLMRTEELRTGSHLNRDVAQPTNKSIDAAAAAHHAHPSLRTVSLTTTSTDIGVVEGRSQQDPSPRRTRPQSASSASNCQRYFGTTGGHTSPETSKRRQRPQSAKTRSAAAPNDSTARSSTSERVPSKWTEMLHHSPSFRQPNLKRLEAETNELLRSILARKRKTNYAPRDIQRRRQCPDSTTKQERQIASKSASQSQSGSIQVARGSGVQVARTKMQQHNQHHLDNLSLLQRPDSPGAIGMKQLTAVQSTLGHPESDEERRDIREKTRLRTAARKQTAAKNKKSSKPPAAFGWRTAARSDWTARASFGVTDIPDNTRQRQESVSQEIPKLMKTKPASRPDRTFAELYNFSGSDLPPSTLACKELRTTPPYSQPRSARDQSNSQPQHGKKRRFSKPQRKKRTQGSPRQAETALHEIVGEEVIVGSVSEDGVLLEKQDSCRDTSQEQHDDEPQFALTMNQRDRGEPSPTVVPADQEGNEPANSSPPSSDASNPLVVECDLKAAESDAIVPITQPCDDLIGILADELDEQANIPAVVPPLVLPIARHDHFGDALLTPSLADNDRDAIEVVAVDSSHNCDLNESADSLGDVLFDQFAAEPAKDGVDHTKIDVSSSEPDCPTPTEQLPLTTTTADEAINQVLRRSDIDCLMASVPDYKTEESNEYTASKQWAYDDDVSDVDVGSLGDDGHDCPSGEIGALAYSYEMDLESEAPEESEHGMVAAANENDSDDADAVVDVEVLSTLSPTTSDPTLAIDELLVQHGDYSHCEDARRSNEFRNEFNVDEIERPQSRKVSADSSSDNYHPADSSMVVEGVAALVTEPDMLLNGTDARKHPAIDLSIVSITPVVCESETRPTPGAVVPEDFFSLDDHDETLGVATANDDYCSQVGVHDDSKTSSMENVSPAASIQIAASDSILLKDRRKSICSLENEMTAHDIVDYCELNVELFPRAPRSASFTETCINEQEFKSDLNPVAVSMDNCQIQIDDEVDAAVDSQSECTTILQQVGSGGQDAICHEAFKSPSIEHDVEHAENFHFDVSGESDPSECVEVPLDAVPDSSCKNLPPNAAELTDKTKVCPSVGYDQSGTDMPCQTMDILPDHETAAILNDDHDANVIVPVAEPCSSEQLSRTAKFVEMSVSSSKQDSHEHFADGSIGASELIYLESLPSAGDIEVIAEAIVNGGDESLLPNVDIHLQLSVESSDECSAVAELNEHSGDRDIDCSLSPFLEACGNENSTNQLPADQPYQDLLAEPGLTENGVSSTVNTTNSVDEVVTVANSNRTLPNENMAEIEVDISADQQAINERDMLECASVARILRQYRCFARRRLLLDQLHFFVTNHRRQERKKAKRESLRASVVAIDRVQVPPVDSATPPVTPAIPTPEHEESNMQDELRSLSEDTHVECEDEHDSRLLDDLAVVSQIPDNKLATRILEEDIEQPALISTPDQRVDDVEERVISQQAHQIEPITSVDMEDATYDLIVEAADTVDTVDTVDAVDAFDDGEISESPFNEGNEINRGTSGIPESVTDAPSTAKNASSVSDSTSALVSNEDQNATSTVGRAISGDDLQREKEDRWERHMDSTFNKSFYFNPKTNVSQWTAPTSKSADKCLPEQHDEKLGDSITREIEPGSAEDIRESKMHLQSSLSVQYETNRDIGRASHLLSPRETQSPTNAVSFEYTSAGGESTGISPAPMTSDNAIETTEVDSIIGHSNDQPSEVMTSSAGNESGNGVLLSTRTDSESTVSSAVETIHKDLRRKSSIMGAKRGEWQAFVDEATGHTFYYNSATGESTWTPPNEFQDTIADIPPEDPTSTSPWTMYIDPASGAPYYVNLITNETSWERPDQDAVENERAQETVVYDLASHAHGIESASDANEKDTKINPGMAFANDDRGVSERASLDAMGRPMSKKVSTGALDEEEYIIAFDDSFDGGSCQ